MKNSTTIIGIIALNAIIGFSLIACSSGPSKEEYQALQERLNQLERQGQQQQQQPAPQTAPAQQSQQYTVESHFQTEAISGGLRITGYTGPRGDVRIPPTINGRSVVAIGDYAFSLHRPGMFEIPDYGLTSVTIPNSVISIGEGAFTGNRELVSVIIPNGVTTISKEAFRSCRLTSVTIPNSVTSIGEDAFLGSRLTTLTIPDSVTTIGRGAFYGSPLISVSVGNGCTSDIRYIGGSNALTTMNIASGNPVYSSVDGVVYNKTRTTLIYWPRGKTTINIPSFVTAIGHDAFFLDKNISHITIPNNVTVLEGDRWDNHAFYGGSLTSITIGANVTINGEGFGELTGNDRRRSNGFKEAYNNGGKRAGTYTRPNIDSTTWTRQ
jgi:hypothetical protein